MPGVVEIWLSLQMFRVALATRSNLCASAAGQRDVGGGTAYFQLVPLKLSIPVLTYGSMYSALSHEGPV